MVENTVDSTTGMVTVRGMMNNPNETLWPGTLVKTKLIVRTEDAVDGAHRPRCSAARPATSCSWCKDGKAHVQPVEVSRTFQGLSVISKGLSGGEDVVTDGQMLLTQGTRVEPAPARPGPEP